MHPKVQAFYDQNKDLDYIKSVQDNLEEKFNEQVSSDKTHIAIERIYRVKLGGLKSSEHVWYEQRETARDSAGNDIVFFRTEGKFDMPKAQYRWNGANKKELAGISDVQTEYEIPWSSKLIDDFEEKGLISDRTQCYIQTISKVYGPFYVDVFRSTDFEDLAFLGQHGKLPTSEDKQVMVGVGSRKTAGKTQQQQQQQQSQS